MGIPLRRFHADRQWSRMKTIVPSFPFVLPARTPCEANLGSSVARGSQHAHKCPSWSRNWEKRLSKTRTIRPWTSLAFEDYLSTPQRHKYGFSGGTAYCTFIPHSLI